MPTVKKNMFKKINPDIVLLAVKSFDGIITKRKQEDLNLSRSFCLISNSYQQHHL